MARAQEILRKCAQNMALKADLVKATPKNQRHVGNAMSGGAVTQHQGHGANLQGNKERNMTPIQEEETEQEEERLKVVEGAAGNPATVESVGTVMKFQTSTSPIHAHFLRIIKMIQEDL